MPEYELSVYRRQGTKTQRDIVNFNKDQTLILEGSYLPDVPLSSYLAQHQLSQATITQIAREIDPKKKPAVTVKNESYDIYGYCDFDQQTSLSGAKNLKSSTPSLKRLILKTDNDKANDLTVKIRRNLLKRCQKMCIRTDIQAEGLYFVKSWLLQLIPQFEQELSKPKGANGDDAAGEPYEFASFGDDFVPFIAKNQFKSRLRKMAPLPKKDSVENKIALIMNPMQMAITKDYVRVLLHIIPKTTAECYFPPIDSMAHYFNLKSTFAAL